MYHRLSVWITTAAAMALLIAQPVAAAFVPRIGLDSTGRGVTINGQVAVRFQASNGSLSAAERARITADRLTNLANSGANLRAVFLKSEKWQARVMVGESLICIVTAADAKAARTTAAALGGSWVRNMRGLLAMPAIVLSDKQLVVPLGETRRVYVSGAATGAISPVSQNSSVATAGAGTDGRYVQVSGQSVGQATIEVVVEGERALVDVWVRKYAGTVARATTAEVTGAPCPRHLIEYAARQAVLRQAVLEPGASIRVEGLDGADRALQPGLTREVKAKVTMQGEGYLTYSGQATVQVHNSVIPRDQVGELFYSNNPERLLKYQTLFAGKLEPGKATRLLYHHQNAVGKRTKLVVEIINSGPAASAFRVTKAASGPMIDTVLVGYLAGGAFLRDEHANATVVERVAPQSRLILVADMLGHLETSSGILQIKQTEGSDAHIRVSALPPDSEEAQVQVGAVVPAPAMIAMQMSDQVYPKPAKVLEAGYVVGERWAFIPIGRHAITDTAAQKKLYGNYGVTYDIKVKVENPTNQTKKVSVILEPSAGLASGVFIIDGEFVSQKYAKPPSEYPLASYQMKPGETRNVRIVTVPMAGSNYPVTLVVRS